MAAGTCEVLAVFLSLNGVDSGTLERFCTPSEQQCVEVIDDILVNQGEGMIPVYGICLKIGEAVDDGRKEQK